eukprot:Gb_36070 [translate_table: standard]
MEFLVTDLHWAVRSNNAGMIKKLLSGGNSVQSIDSIGRTPLHWAIVLGHEEALKALLLNTSRQLIDFKDKLGRTCLHYACASGKTDFASVLIRRGASVNAEDSKGRTPLHYAAQNAKPDTVALLLNRGANKDAGDCNGVKAWDLAMKWGCPRGFEVLRTDSAQLGSFAESKTEELEAKMKKNAKISGDIGRNTEIPMHTSCIGKPSSLDLLLCEWKKAEEEARNKKKGTVDGLKEALKAWREAETEAKLEKQRILSHQSAHIVQDLKNQVPSSASDSLQGLQNGDSSRMYYFCSCPNENSGSPAFPHLFFCKKEGQGNNRVEDSWGCTEWESPVPVEDIKTRNNAVEKWEKMMEWRSGSRLHPQTSKEPWVAKREQTSASVIEAI